MFNASKSFPLINIAARTRTTRALFEGGLERRERKFDFGGEGNRLVRVSKSRRWERGSGRADRECTDDPT